MSYSKLINLFWNKNFLTASNKNKLWNLAPEEILFR